MGAANCCKKPEEVLEEGKFMEVGGNYDNPHVTPLDKNEREGEGQSGFPHDSESLALRAQAQNASVGVAASGEAANATNDQEEANNTAGQNDAKLYEQYFDATKIGSAYDVPSATGNVAGVDAQNQNAAAGFDFQGFKTQSPEGQAYDAAGANSEQAGVAASQGFDANAAGVKTPTSNKAQNFELQQSGTPANAQFEIPQADATGTATTTKLAAGYEYQALSPQGGNDFANFMQETTQPPRIITTVKTPIITSNIAPEITQSPIQADTVAVQAGVTDSAQNNEIIASAQNNQSEYTFAASANASANVGASDLGNLMIQDTNIQVPATAETANIQYAVPPMNDPNVLTATSNNLAGYDLGNTGVDLGTGAAIGLDMGTMGVGVDLGLAAGTTTGMEATTVGPIIGGVSTDYASYGIQGVTQATDLGPVAIGATTAVPSVDFGSYDLGAIQTGQLMTTEIPGATSTAFLETPIATNYAATSYQIPATTTTTTTRTFYQSAYAAPTTTATAINVGLPTTTFASTVIPGTFV